MLIEPLFSVFRENHQNLSIDLTRAFAKLKNEIFKILLIKNKFATKNYETFTPNFNSRKFVYCNTYICNVYI